MRWDELLASGEGAELDFERVPFAHPLWVLYSSGTTGLPKAIVQGQGGILLEHLKKLHLHVDAHPGDRLFWFTTTGWMMWNFLVSGLLTRAAIVLYDGNPGHPDMGVLWDLAERAGITMFGTSAAYIAACMKDGVVPGEGRDLSRLERGRLDRLPPLPRGLRLGLRAARRRHLAVLDQRRHRPLHRLRRRRAAAAGLPRRAPGAGAGRRGRGLGRGRQLRHRRGRRAGRHRADALDAASTSGATPTAAATAPATSSSYPGVWRHGDWIEITPRGTAIIYGRSDSTINRGGIRMGTSEIYRAVLGLDDDRRRARRRRPPLGHRRLDAALRRPPRGSRARRRAPRRDRPPDPRELLPAPRPRRGLRDLRGAAHPAATRCSRCR